MARVLPHFSIPAAVSSLRSEVSYIVPTTITRLRVLLNLPLNTREALTFFWQRQERGVFLYLYRKYLPDEYRLSQESEEIDEGWNYSPREVEFFYLVSDHLFPLDIDYLSEAGASGERATEMIPLLPYEMPWWNNLEDLPPGWQLLAYLSGTLPAKEIERQSEVFAGLPDDLRVDLSICGRAMHAAPFPEQEAICQFFLGLDAPYAGFGQVLALYQRRTGIGWLDTAEDELFYEDFCWCDDHFARLIAAYQTAQQWEARANAFATWLQQDMRRIHQLLSLLKPRVSAFEEKPKRRRRESDADEPSTLQADS